MPITGSVILNGITDPQLIKILQAKEKNPSFQFNPQTMQSAAISEGGQPKAVYNNAALIWHAGDGLKAVRDLLNELLV
jgi:hypothetical protein